MYLDASFIVIKDFNIPPMIFRDTVKKGIITSMSRRGNCFDNAVIETFYCSLKSVLCGFFIDWDTIIGYPYKKQAKVRRLAQ